MLNNRALLKAEWQNILFSESPKRLKLSGLQPEWELEQVRIRVHRNHSFEMVESSAAPYFYFADLKPEYIYSDYDDSLSFQLDAEADVELIWLDLDRYKESLDFESWIKERVSFLIKATHNPVLAVFIDDGGNLQLTDISGLYQADLHPIQEKLGSAFYDLGKTEYSGTRLSNKSCILIAREFGTKWLPALVKPAIKGLVLDLDNTLYQGILGEDGIEGINISKGHQTLQQQLLQLKEQGFFLALCSRNEEQDVLEMMEKNTGFQIKLDDLSAYRVNWESKAQNILQIAQELRISPNALLFIDDNAGELVEVTEAITSLKTIHAKDNPEETLAALKSFPNLFKWNISEEDKKRIDDLKASKIREEVSTEHISPEDYLKKLGVILSFEQDLQRCLPRIVEMSNKTNQFNLNFMRYNAIEIDTRFEDDRYTFVTCRLRDNLSDSGIISVIILRKEGKEAVVEEICISGRALGRRIEDTVLMKSFELARQKLHCDSISVEYKTGERNQPGLKWLASASGDSLADHGLVKLIQLGVPFENAITIEMLEE